MNALPTTTPHAGDSAMIRIKERMREIVRRPLEPLVALLMRLRVHPHVLTAAGLLSSLAAGLAFFEGGFRSGAALLALSGLCDILDGELARRRAVVSKFGAFLDSTLDRLAEAATLTGIAGFYIVNLLELAHDPSRVLAEIERGLEPRTWAVVALTAMLALVGSFLVSYTRARAEALGMQCRVGWFERPERMILLILAAAFGVGPLMPGALLVLTVLSFATAIQRVVYVWNNTREP